MARKCSSLGYLWKVHHIPIPLLWNTVDSMCAWNKFVHEALAAEGLVFTVDKGQGKNQMRTVWPLLEAVHCSPQMPAYLFTLPFPCWTKLSSSNVPSIVRTWRPLKIPVTPSLIKCEESTRPIFVCPAIAAMVEINDNRHYLMIRIQKIWKWIWPCWWLNTAVPHHIERTRNIHSTHTPLRHHVGVRFDPWKVPSSSRDKMMMMTSKRSFNTLTVHQEFQSILERDNRVQIMG